MAENKQTDMHDFMNLQQNVLFSIAEPYQQKLDILACQCDELSAKRKADIWFKITEEYNTKCSSNPLSVDTIQKYYKFNKTKEKDTNFTKQDEELLLKIIGEYKHILESVQSDSESLEGKEVAWAEITIQFNAQCSNNHLKTKIFLQRYYESRFIQSNEKNSSQGNDNNIKIEEVQVKDEMSEIVADALCPDQYSDVLMTEELEPVHVKEENIEDTDEPALEIEEVNLSPEFKEEFIDEEETAVDPMEMSNRTFINTSDVDEDSQSSTSEEDNHLANKRTHENAFGSAIFSENSSSSSSSSDSEHSEINRFLGFETKQKFLHDKLEMNRQHQLKKLELEEQKLLLNLEMQENRLRQFREETDLRLKLLELDVEITKKQLELTKKSKLNK